MQASETILAAMRLHQWSAAEIAAEIGMTPSALSRALKNREIPEQHSSRLLAALGLRMVSGSLSLTQEVLLRWQLSPHGRGRESPSLGDLALMLQMLPEPRSALRLEIDQRGSGDWQNALRSQIRRAGAEDALVVYVIRGGPVWRLLYVRDLMRPETEKLLAGSGKYSEAMVHDKLGTDTWSRITRAARPAEMDAILSDILTEHQRATWEDVHKEAERAGLTPTAVLQLVREHENISATVPARR